MMAATIPVDKTDAPQAAVFTFDEHGHILPGACDGHGDQAIFDISDCWVVDAEVFTRLMFLRKTCELAGFRHFVLRGAPGNLCETIRLLGLQVMFTLEEAPSARTPCSA